MSIYRRIYSQLQSDFKRNERFCLICGKSLNHVETIEDLFCSDPLVCRTCRESFRLHRAIYRINGIDWHVLYEYDEFIERLFFRFKEQRDIVLAPVFLIHAKIPEKYELCVACSSEKKRLERGFEPMIEIFKSHQIDVSSPFYKNKEVKQTRLSAAQRVLIKEVLQKKKLWEFSGKPVILVDDVCTTGSTMQRLCELTAPQAVFLLAAHPEWIREHQSQTIEKHSLFW